MELEEEETLGRAAVPRFVIPWTGRLLIIGLGTVGRGLLPLLRRHFNSNIAIVAIDPDRRNRAVAESYGVEFQQTALTAENFRAAIDAVFAGSSGKFIVNVSTNVSSLSIVDHAHRIGALYVDTTIDPWPGVYFNADLPAVERSNYLLRHSLLSTREQWSGGPTAVSCCGANPGAASWFVKQALLNLSKDLGHPNSNPSNSSEWAELMMKLGVKGVHIAERDWQIPRVPASPATLTNTWSAEGFLAESLQAAELGWGTHELSFPHDGIRFGFGSDAAILINKPSASVKVWTWTPTAGGHHAHLITYNEALSIADYFTVMDEGDVRFRPTCHYAYRPIDAACEGIESVIAGGGLQRLS
jgi:homospermidine synthase